jgi:hypothetical protein
VYNQIAEALAPKSPGNKEASLLFNELVNGGAGVRSELIAMLVSKEGQRVVMQGSEKEFHVFLLKTSVYNRSLILAIRSFEKFCRLLYNAYYEMLQWMKDHQSKGTLKAFSSLTLVKKASSELPAAFIELEANLEPFMDEAYSFHLSFQSFQEHLSPKDWVRMLIEHHIRIQKSKPPNGKAPWILEYGSETYLLNNIQELPPELNDEYVHQYRTYSLQSFMKDLGKL